LRQELLERSDLHGDAFCHALAHATDGWLAGLLDHATEGDLNGLALMAVGGYGRGELWPGSDLDVVLVHERRRDVGAIADAVWYPVWDEGVRLDHSVRRPAEVLEVAAEDLRAQLGLLDGRLVAGDAAVVSTCGGHVPDSGSPSSPNKSTSAIAPRVMSPFSSNPI
jgi:[protein-PII] uridylyltransferase